MKGQNRQCERMFLVYFIIYMIFTNCTFIITHNLYIYIYIYIYGIHISIDIRVYAFIYIYIYIYIYIFYKVILLHFHTYMFVFITMTNWDVTLLHTLSENVKHFNN